MKKTPQFDCYHVCAYGITGPSHVETVLYKHMARHEPIPVFYNPETRTVGIKFHPRTADEVRRLHFDLVMLFMRGLIEGYEEYLCYASKRTTLVAAYGRDENGRRYRLLKPTANKTARRYIDPEPQCQEEAAQAA